jgi:hydroxymethylglutaryl-CoA lyase
MTNSVEIVEVGPRDGLQSEPDLLPTAVKVALIKRLIATGLRRIEVASFVNPKRVPQMADAEAVMAALPKDNNLSYIGLVLNRKGLERALAAGCNEIGMAVVASETFNRRNQGVSTEQSIQDWLAIAGAARAAGVRAHVTISAAFGCPFEGEVPADHVVAIAKQVAAADPFEISVADTIGVGVPAQVKSLLERIRVAVPGITLRCHFHNTRNTAVANTYAALEAGVRVFDSSVGGAGGCPFAPAATGNVATEDLLYLLQRSGYVTGISLEQMIEVAHWLQPQLQRGISGSVQRAGVFPG